MNDWLKAAGDPRVVAVVLARGVFKDHWWILVSRLARCGITATEDQARALLDAVAAVDTYPSDDVPGPWRARLDAAVAAIAGEQPPQPDQRDMRYPENRPTWLGKYQPWPCGRCGKSEDAADPHDCSPPAIATEQP